ncbi:DUF3631 domain-containing protein [Streptomyces sp. NPDC088789]|uniref:DUF3631 domain-containing protein n=1 Tax=Streptomyces sp. NPDC088789 TaxID=3365899 RepID=UPI003820C639
MTPFPFPFPSALDYFAASHLGTVLPPALPRHQAILDAVLDVQDLDRQLVGEDSPALDKTLTPRQQIEQLTDVLTERLAAGHELALLLARDCCACATPSDEDAGGGEFLSCPGDRPQPPGIVHAALGIFAGHGDPDALASVDLVAALRTLPGWTEGPWRYADLTPARLARLLAPYEVQSRDITLPGGRRRKAYRRAALLAAAHR